MKCKVLMDDRIIVLPDEVKKKSDGGILFPDTAVPEVVQGVVIHIGIGKKCEFAILRHPMTVKVGDRVQFTSWSKAKVELEGQPRTCYIMLENEVVMVVE